MNTGLPVPYYDQDGITIYNADCRDILPLLPKVDLVLTDPPYGIGRDKGLPTTANSWSKRKAYRDSNWDSKRPEAGLLNEVACAGEKSIIWGGNFFADLLPKSTHWLVWDKQNTMPTFSDCEVAWTNVARCSVKMLRLNGNGLMGDEVQRDHPTQKPIKLMTWCLSFFPDAQTILDPFMGSGTTLVAAKLLGKKAIGIELEEKYCQIAVDRLAQGNLFSEEVKW